MKVKVNGMDRIALVDSGCSSSVASGMLCRPEVRKRTAILTAGRKCLLSHGVGSITLTVPNRNPLKSNVLVVNSKPLRFDLLLGMYVIKKLGGVHIDEWGKAHFAEAAYTLGATIELEQPDFRAKFDQRTKSWTVSWKWSGDQPPEKLYNRVPQSTIPARARAEYDKERQNWIDNGWLVPYPEDNLGPPKGLIPLMAVIQQNKQKVRLVLNYRELNDHVDPFTARAEICTEKLREWRRAGSNVSALDLRKAYLQVRVHQSPWGLVSMWHYPSCRQLLMLSWRRTSAYSGQHLPILMMCMWTRVLCLRHVWRSISTALATSARSRRGYRMVREYSGYMFGERITLCIGEEGTKSQTRLESSRDGTYFHYAANWLDTFLWVVGFV